MNPKHKDPRIMIEALAAIRATVSIEARSPRQVAIDERLSVPMIADRRGGHGDYRPFEPSALPVLRLLTISAAVNVKNFCNSGTYTAPVVRVIVPR